MKTLRQYIEQFHLIFLDQLGRKIDKRLYVLKGGCNLRFYFKSFRYSEDIDFDTHIISPSTLRKNVTNILESKSLQNILQANEIITTSISAPKQTTTTQRWKINFTITKLNLDAHTKIEFSRRESHGIGLFEAVDSSISNEYHLPPVFLHHYDRHSMVLQKIGALAGRNITQARDIFDLHLLIDNTPIGDLSQGISKQQIVKALQNLNGLKYQDFLSQVVPYLFTEYQQTYASPDVWSQIIGNVKRALQCS